MVLFEHGYALLIGVGTTKDPGLSLVAGKQRDACLNLPEVYTALLTMSTAAHEAQIEAKREILERERLRSAVDMLNAEKRLVLLGDPGSGKSMFVNFVTLCMAGELLQEQDTNCKLLVKSLPNEEGKLEEQPQPLRPQRIFGETTGISHKQGF